MVRRSQAVRLAVTPERRAEYLAAARRHLSEAEVHLAAVFERVEYDVNVERALGDCRDALDRLGWVDR